MPKLLRCDGNLLEVFDLGPVVYRVSRRTGGVPIKQHGWRVLDDEAARAVLVELRSTGLYDAEIVK